MHAGVHEHFGLPTLTPRVFGGRPFETSHRQPGEQDCPGLQEQLAGVQGHAEVQEHFDSPLRSAMVMILDFLKEFVG